MRHAHFRKHNRLPIPRSVHTNLHNVPVVHPQHRVQPHGLLVDQPLLQLRRTRGIYADGSRGRADADGADAHPLAVSD
jgi:hypothetical protein